MTTLRAAGVLILFLLAAVPVTAQESSPARPARPVRVVLASAKLPSVVPDPLHWKLFRVTVPAGQSAAYTGPPGMLHVLSGSITLGLGAGRQALQEGEAAFVPAGDHASMAPGRSGPAVLLHFVLLPAAELDRALHSPATMATALHQTAQPIPGLKAGPYELSMTRVSVQPRTPAPPLHHRSGAALYYVLAGTWSIHLQEGREPRARGAVQFEPNGFVHTWELVGDTAGALLQANISPEGSPEIIFLPRP